MPSTWIETPARGRHGGPVRAGMWSSVVVGTHPIEANQEVWLEVNVDDEPIGLLPAFWQETKGVNNLWHVPIPPQAVGVKIHYRVGARSGDDVVHSPFQNTVVRPNLPDRSDPPTDPQAIHPEGIIGNRTMTVRVDSRGGTHDVYFPTVGLRSHVRPAEGELSNSRCHFRAIASGLSVEQRLDWFAERGAWSSFQHYQGATNLLVTELTHRSQPIRVLATDFVAMGNLLPSTAGGTENPGQYLKRYRILNDGAESRSAIFGLYVQAEVNGGIGESGLMWRDEEKVLVATNRGHGHANRKLARDATVEFAVALDGRGEVSCEPTGPNDAILIRKLELPGNSETLVDVLVTAAFTGWRSDPGTFEHWIQPALTWFRSHDLDLVEQATAQEWDAYVEPLPNPKFPKPTYAVSLRRSALTAALHSDASWGAIAAGFDRGLSAYCWPRDAMWTAGAFERLGHPELGRHAYQWLAGVKGQNRPYSYWFQKYTIDGHPEWETPAVDQTAMIPFSLERHYRRTGDREFLLHTWPMIERAASVCCGHSGHPGLKLLPDLMLISSAGIWDSRHGAFFYSNCAVVAGLRAASTLAELLDRPERAREWTEMADQIWVRGILGMDEPVGVEPHAEPAFQGMLDPISGRYLDARRVSTIRGLWSDDPAKLIDRSAGVDISLLGAVVPFGLLPASDPGMRKTAEAIFRNNAVTAETPLLARSAPDPAKRERKHVGELAQTEFSSLATLWMARYLIQLGRETGEGRHWNLALSMLDGLLSRIGSLGLALRPLSKGEARSSHVGPVGVWGLHAMLAETLLDLAGMEYDAPRKTLTIDPALPAAWPQLGLTCHYPCGEVSYSLERPIGGNVHALRIRSTLRHPIRLEIGVTCPGLNQLGPWRSTSGDEPPRFDDAVGRVMWSVDLPEGEATLQATWG